MSEPEVQNKMMVFLQQLMGLEAAGTDVYSLLTPENIFLGPKGIHLDKRKVREENAGALKIYPGYSAPESYDNYSSKASSVYFAGALMAMLLTGRRPENAIKRKETGELVFAEAAPSTLRRIVNEAMCPGAERRAQGLAGLQYQLGSALPAIQMENAAILPYRGGSPYAAGQPLPQVAPPPYPPAGPYPYGQPPQAGQRPQDPRYPR